MTVHRTNAPVFAVVLLSTTLLACSDAGDGGGGSLDAGIDAGRDARMGDDSCAEGVVRCDGTTAKVCDGEGGVAETIDCAESGMRCVPSQISQVTGQLLPLGCVECEPGEGSCVDDAARFCREDGRFVDFECDAEQGLSCEPDGCKGACAPPEVTSSYLGCDYFPTVTLNPVWQGFDFAIAIANASGQETAVRITRGAQTVQTLSIAADSLQVVSLPWVTALKGGDVNACQIAPEPGGSQRVEGGAYRVRTDRPVTVYQLSPLQYQRVEGGGGAPEGCPIGADCPGGGIGTECLSYSNDASLLLPATALGTDYRAMAWPSVGPSASFIAVTATQDATRMRVQGFAAFSPGGGVDATGGGDIMLDRGDVLQLVADYTQAPGDDGFGVDLSGTRIRADKPVQVIGGQSCAYVPKATTGYCDHLEHAQWPSDILGDDYVVSYPAAPSSTSPYVLRVAAVVPDTRVVFSPASVHGPVTLQPGEPPLTVEVGAFERDAGNGVVTDEPPADVRVTGDEPFLVAQYMEGERAVPSGAGDPSMAMVVPVAQYRTQYTFVASSTYDRNYINLVVPPGVTPQLDGAPVTASRAALEDGQWEVMRVELEGDDEAHTVSADEPFGLVVYGYGRFTSYMYPGGLDLRRIAPLAPE